MFIRLLLPLLSFSLYPFLRHSLRLIPRPHFSTFFPLHAASTTASMKCHLTRRKCSIQRSLQWLYICRRSVSGVCTENHKIIARVMFDKIQSYTLHRYRAVSILGAFKYNMEHQTLRGYTKRRGIHVHQTACILKSLSRAILSKPIKSNYWWNTFSKSYHLHKQEGFYTSYPLLLPEYFVLWTIDFKWIRCLINLINTFSFPFQK